MERGSFDKLVLEHLPAMQRLAVRLTGNAHDAEDLMQDALLKAVRHRKTFRGEAAFGTWMTRIVINAFRDLLASNRKPVLKLSPERTTHPADQPVADDLARHVARCVSTLPPRQREVIVLTVYEQLSTPEAAAVLGMTEKNVRTTLHHARRKLGEMLAPQLEGKTR